MYLRTWPKSKLGVDDNLKSFIESILPSIKIVNDFETINIVMY